jgi:hypothetical protein
MPDNAVARWEWSADRDGGEHARRHRRFEEMSRRFAAGDKTMMRNGIMCSQAAFSRLTLISFEM